MTTTKSTFEREKIKLIVEKKFWSGDDNNQDDEITEIIMNLTLNECEHTLSKANKEFEDEIDNVFGNAIKNKYLSKNAQFVSAMILPVIRDAILEIHKKTHGESKCK